MQYVIKPDEQHSITTLTSAYCKTAHRLASHNISTIIR
jgi:hypothetical protein